MGANRDSRIADTFDSPKRVSAASGTGLLASPNSLDSTLPPTPLFDLLAAEGATIFALSDDRELARTVEQAGDDRYPIHWVRDWIELVGAAIERRAHVVLLDADSLPFALPEAIATLREASPSVVVLAAVRRSAAQAAMSMLSEHKIHRLLIKPAADGITRLLLESAVGQYLQLRDQSALAPVLLDDIGPRQRYSRRRTFGLAWVLATALVALTVGAVAVVEIYGVRWREVLDRMTSDGSDRGGLAASPSAGSYDEALLARAEPVRRPVALSLEDPLASAATTVVQATSTLRSEGESVSVVLLDGQPQPTPPQSARVDGQGSSSGVMADDGSGGANRIMLDASARVDTTARLEEADASVLGPEPAPNESAPRATDLDRLVDLIDARLANGGLLTPDDESAATYLERAMTINPLDPRLLARRDAIAASLVAAARAAVEREDLEEAQRLADEAFRLGAERSALTRVDRELATARRAEMLAQHEQILSTARALLRQGQLLDSDGEGALTRLATLRRERSPVPGLAETWRELTEAVASNVSAAIDARDFAAAKSWASALAIEGGELARAAELEFQARQAEFLATPIPAGQLELIEAPVPVYPSNALLDGNEGWVDVEFIVDREGRSRDITVVDSRPGRRFVDAAIEAIAGQRYAPFLHDGRVYERRVRARVRFELK